METMNRKVVIVTGGGRQPESGLALAEAFAKARATIPLNVRWRKN